MASDPRWLDAKTAAEYISVRVDALPRLVRQGRIPAPHKFSDRRGERWSADEIDEKMTAASTKPRRGRNAPSSPLREIGDIIKDSNPKFPMVSGVYFLIKNHEIVYVGQSVDIMSRVSSHVSAGEKDFDRWSYVVCPVDELNETELAYILALRPSLNVMLTQSWRIGSGAHG